jgi:hypothetical protein
MPPLMLYRGALKKRNWRCTLSVPTFELFDRFRREAATLLEIVAKRVNILAGTTDEGWTITDDVVLFLGRIFLPASSVHWATMLEQAHSTGHEGVQKTLQWLQVSFYTPQDNQLVREFIKGCAICQQFKTEHLHPVGLLQPLAVPSSIWSDIALDF